MGGQGCLKFGVPWPGWASLGRGLGTEGVREGAVWLMSGLG